MDNITINTTFTEEEIHAITTGLRMFMYENKYLNTREQQQRIVEAIAPYMQPDAYGRSTIRNVYFFSPHN